MYKIAGIVINYNSIIDIGTTLLAKTPEEHLMKLKYLPHLLSLNANASLARHMTMTQPLRTYIQEYW